MKDNFYVQIGQRIKSIREKKKYTREYISYKTGISAKFLYEIEYGIKGFSADSLYKIAQVLEVSSEYLLNGCNTNNHDNDLGEILKMFTQDEKEYLLKMIKEMYAVFK